MAARTTWDWWKNATAEPFTPSRETAPTAAEDAATRWEEDRSTGTECRSIDWAEIRPIYIMVVKNTTKNLACMVNYKRFVMCFYYKSITLLVLTIQKKQLDTAVKMEK